MLTDAILNREPPQPAALNPRISPGLQAILLKGLDKERDRRYQSAREMAVDLERLSFPATTAGYVVKPGWMRQPRAGIIFVAAGLGLAGAIYYFTALRGGSGDEPRIGSIAVLPLANLSGDAQQEYFADGMTEELTSDLSKLGSLRVISRTSVMQYKNTRKTAPEIARELNVDAVVEGSVLRSGDRVRITAQLINARADQHLWSESYERDMRDVLALQNEVARAIAGEIRLKLTPAEQTRLNAAPRVDPAAYDLYLRGKYHGSRENEADNTESIRMLEQAVAADPKFPDAYAGLADAYLVRAFYFAPKDPQWPERASVATDKALALDPDSAEAHIARGRILWSPAYHFQHADAMREFRRAIVLNPSNDEARHQLALIYIHIGRLDEALGQLQKAISINPSNVGAHSRVGVAYLYMRQFDRAWEIFQTIPPEFNPSLVANQNAWTLLELGRRQEALAVANDFLKKSPQDIGGLVTSVRGLIYAEMGDRVHAEADIKHAAEIGKGYGHFHHTEYGIGEVYAILGNKREALVWLKLAAEDGLPCYPLFVRDMHLENLKNDPEYQQFLEGIRKQWEGYRKDFGQPPE